MDRDVSYSSTYMFERWSEVSLQDVLEAARGPASRLIDRLRREDGAAWLRRELEAKFGPYGLAVENLLKDGGVDVETLKRIKQAAKGIFRTSKQPGDDVIGKAGYFFSIAAGLAYHGELISGKGRDRIDSVLADLSRVAPDPWKDLLRKALQSKQQFPYLDTRMVKAYMDQSGEGRKLLNSRVMSMYHTPLQIYYRGSRFYGLGDPEDIVNGFFASRLVREDYFEKWLTKRESREITLRLSEWLINGLFLYLKEQIRKLDKGKREVPIEEPDQFEADSGPERDYYLSLTVEILEEAIRRAEEDAPRESLRNGCRAFVAKHREGKRFRQIAAELGIAEERARKLSSEAKAYIARVFRDVLLEHGVNQDEVGDVVTFLLSYFDTTKGRQG